jgi:hypothetical protein
MGKGELSIRLSVVFSDCGQRTEGPSGVLAQSNP